MKTIQIFLHTDFVELLRVLELNQASDFSDSARQQYGDY
jgi:hypothetical protein